MFCDGRSQRVIFLAHCLLNQNAISDGTAVCPAAFQEALQILLNAKVGLVQMPCPELCCLGLDRGDVQGADRPVTAENTRIRHALERSPCRECLEALAEQTVWQIEEYRRYGFQIVGIVASTAPPAAAQIPHRTGTARSRERGFSWRPLSGGWQGTGFRF